MSNDGTSLIRTLRHPLKFRLYLLSNLPNALFAGVRIRNLGEEICEVSVPYKWFTKNPFRSTYFACLGMAAEMSTGALCLAHIHNSKRAVSMLVVRMESEYFKKATGRTYFVCEDGLVIKQAIADAIASGEPRTIRARSVGKNDKGIVVAEFYITWSFKAKK